MNNFFPLQSIGILWCGKSKISKLQREVSKGKSVVTFVLLVLSGLVCLRFWNPLIGLQIYITNSSFCFRREPAWFVFTCLSNIHKVVFLFCVCKLYNIKYRRGTGFYTILRKRTLIILLRRELTWDDIRLIAFVCIYIRFPSV